MTKNCDESVGGSLPGRPAKASGGSPSLEKSEFEVGYRKPPKATRFKPGSSGNPKGRKKKPPTVAEQTQKILAQKVTVTVDGKRKSLSTQAIMLKSIANAGMKGDLKSVAFLFELQSSHRDSAATSIDSRKLDGEAQALLDDYVKQFQVGEPVPASDREGDNDRANQVADTDTPPLHGGSLPHRQKDAVLPGIEVTHVVANGSDGRERDPAEHPGGISETPHSADAAPPAQDVTVAYKDGAPEKLPAEVASGEPPRAEKPTHSASGASPLATAWPEPWKRSDGNQ